LVSERIEVAGMTGGFSQLALGILKGFVGLLVLRGKGRGTSAVKMDAG
jgi:hypothetical protein